VVGADDDAGRAFAADQLVRAVLADVVEGADDPVAAPDAEQALARQVEGHVIARVFQMAGMAGELPGAGQEPCLLGLENRGSV
jgi:hypothetical protein